MKTKYLLPLSLTATLLCSCASFSKHTPAPVETAASLGLPNQAQPPISPEWWRALNDAKLDALIDTALAKSPDLAAVAARLRQAEAGARLADSQSGVKIALNASGAFAHRDSLGGGDKSRLATELEHRLFGDHGVNIGYESLQLQGQWSPDIFGKYRHQLEAALGQKRGFKQIGRAHV